MMKTLMIPVAFSLLLSSATQALALGIFETRYIEEDFRVFHEGHKKNSEYHVPEISINYLLDEYILEKMNMYSESADDFVRKKNGETPLRPRKIMSRSSFSNRVKAAPYLVMKYDIEKNGSKWPINWNFEKREEKVEEQAVYLEHVSSKISEYILAAKKCFSIDPAILTALIHKESYFSPVAVSFTGAAGLTQFTGIAFSEIAMQTGAIPYEADEDAIIYNKKALNCMEDLTGEKIPAIDEIYDGELYYQSSTGRRILRTAAVPTLKDYFKDHMLSSIGYASILLKTYLALECKLAPASMCRWTDNERLIWNKEFLYKKALQRYNGDTNIHPSTGLAVKYKYADDIWQEASRSLKSHLESNVQLAKKQALALQEKVEEKKSELVIECDTSVKCEDEKTPVKPKTTTNKDNKEESSWSWSEFWKRIIN